MKTPLKNIILGWLCIAIGLVPMSAFALICWVGVFNYFDCTLPTMIFVFCLSITALCVLSAVYFFRNGRILFVRKILNAPLWVTTSAIIVFLLFAGAAYELARNGF